MIVTACDLANIAGHPFGSTESAMLGALLDALNSELGPTEVSPTLCLAHFLAQGVVETNWLRNFVEMGGPVYFAQYDGRADLGNSQPGDGFRFRGRGWFMLTGRANYQFAGQLLGLDLLGDPDLAAEPATSIRIAVAYWRHRRVYVPAVADDLQGVTRLINGGLNGLADRQAALTRAKATLGLS